MTRFTVPQPDSRAGNPSIGGKRNVLTPLLIVNKGNKNSEDRVEIGQARCDSMSEYRDHANSWLLERGGMIPGFWDRQDTPGISDPFRHRRYVSETDGRFQSV